MTVAADTPRSTSIPFWMHFTIIGTSIVLGVEGPVGAFAPHVDIGVIIAAWSFMFVALAALAGGQMERDKGLKIAAGLIAAMGGLAMGVKIANAWAAYTGFGTIPAMVCNAGTNALVTYMIGRATAQVFLSEGAGASVDQIINAIMRIIFPWGGGPK